MREVRTLTADEFKDWLAIRYVHNVENRTVLLGASIVVAESDERTRAVLDAMAGTPTTAAFLKPSKGGRGIPLADAFSAAVQTAGTLFDDLVPNGPGKNVELRVRYANDDDHFIVETHLGPIRVHSIIFQGELCVEENLLPLSVTAEYRHLETGEPISQIAAFVPQEIQGMKFSLELDRIAESGETHISLRRMEGCAS